MTYLIMIITVLCAAFLQSTIGFGFSIIAMLVMPRLFPYSEAVTLCMSITVLNTTILSVRNRKHIKWRIALPLLIPSLIISAIFTIWSVKMETKVMDVILGITLILLSIYFCAFSNKIKVNPKPSTGMLMGSIAGIGNGFFGIGGPPAALYLMPAVDDKESYLATIQTYFAISNYMNLILRVSMGYYKMEFIPLTVLGWVGAVTGMALGVQVFKRMDLSFLKKFVYVFVGLNGLYTIIKTLI